MKKYRIDNASGSFPVFWATSHWKPMEANQYPNWSVVATSQTRR
jgi:hypothetical protein